MAFQQIWCIRFECCLYIFLSRFRKHDKIFIMIIIWHVKAMFCNIPSLANKHFLFYYIDFYDFSSHRHYIFTIFIQNTTLSHFETSSWGTFHKFHKYLYERQSYISHHYNVIFSNGFSHACTFIETNKIIVLNWEKYSNPMRIKMNLILQINFYDFTNIFIMTSILK